MLAHDSVMRRLILIWALSVGISFLRALTVIDLRDLMILDNIFTHV